MLEHSEVSGPLIQESSSPPPEVDLTSGEEKVFVRPVSPQQTQQRDDWHREYITPDQDSTPHGSTTTLGPSVVGLYTLASLIDIHATWI